MSGSALLTMAAPRRSFVRRPVTAPQEITSGRQCASTTCRMISPGSRRARAGSCQSFQALCARRNATTGHVKHVGPSRSEYCSPTSNLAQQSLRLSLVELSGSMGARIAEGSALCITTARAHPSSAACPRGLSAQSRPASRADRPSPANRRRSAATGLRAGRHRLRPRSAPRKGPQRGRQRSGHRVAHRAQGPAVGIGLARHQ